MDSDSYFVFGCAKGDTDFNILSSVVTLHWSLNAFSTDSPMKHEATFILTSMGYFDPVRIFIAKLTLSCKTMYTYLKA